MELDHITSKNDFGENYITNRILLCGPCNGRKKAHATLSGLHRENKRVGWMRDEPKAKASLAAARRVAARVPTHGIRPTCKRCSPPCVGEQPSP